MTKRIQITLLSLIMSVCVLASNTSVKNEDGVDIWYDFDAESKTASVTYRGDNYESYSDEYTGEVVIPSKVTYDGVEYSVTSIGNSAFCGCIALTSITLPDGLTSIENSAFSSCRFLTSIILSKSLMSIDNWAFSWCCRLYEIYNKSDLSITAGSNDNGQIAYYAKNVYTDSEDGSKLKTVADYIFYVDGDDIELIAYTGNETSIILPSKYEGKNYNIGNYAFFKCDALTSITLPEGLTSIGECAFDFCSGLTSIVLPEGLTSIGEHAFEGCIGLTSIMIPESVTLIGNHAFNSCSGLISITIPESVTLIEEYAFCCCSALTSIDVASNNNNYTSVDGVLFSKDMTTLIQYPIRKNATSYSIPNGVKKIRDCAFYNCSGLTSINLTEGVTSIGDLAFGRCYNLTSITLSESLTQIGFQAFDCCYKLYEVYNKSDLSIAVGSSDNGRVAIYAKDVYTDSEFESKLKTVGDYIFYVDDEEIELIAYIGDEKSIVLPSKYEEKNYKIGNYAFYDCDVLTSIILPEGLVSIGNYAFYDCDVLTSIILPESLVSIGDYAFYYCRALISITSKNTIPPTIGGIYTFTWVDKSIPVYVPAESVEAYKRADRWKVFTNIQAIDESLTSIVENVVDNVSVRFIGNTIVVEGTDDYTVYTISGQNIGKVESVERGIYIVVANGNSYKVIAK